MGVVSGDHGFAKWPVACKETIIYINKKDRTMQITTKNLMKNKKVFRDTDLCLRKDKFTQR